MEISSAV
jgi:hypothetical protein